MKKIALLPFFLFAGYCLAQTWYPAGNVNGCFSLNVCDNKLYAGGDFGNNQGLGVWAGNKWDTAAIRMKYGLPYAFAMYNNTLFMGGDFNYIDTSFIKKIAQWNGSVWNEPGGGLTQNTDEIHAMAVYNGELYAGGRFTSIGSVSANRIAKWNGTQWKPLGSGLTGGIGTIVNAMAVYNNELYVGGAFYSAGGVTVNNIAKWNGTKWDSVGRGVDSDISAMVVDSFRNCLYVSGGITFAGNVNVRSVAQWNGASWSSLGSGGITDGGLTMAMYHKELYVGGISGHAVQSDTILARWDGDRWYKINGPNNTVADLAVYRDTLYVGGYFTYVGGKNYKYIARWYSPPDTTIGMQEIPGKKFDFLVYPNPSRNSITLKLKENDSGMLMNIADIQGKVILKKRLAAHATEFLIDTSWLSKGMYSVELICGNETVGRSRIVLE